MRREKMPELLWRCSDCDTTGLADIYEEEDGVWLECTECWSLLRTTGAPDYRPLEEDEEYQGEEDHDED
jgi:hypothetical protein